MNILETIRAQVGATFSDTSLVFSDAVLTRVSGGGGWGSDSGGAAMHDCKAMVSNYSDQLRAVAGIPGAYVKVLIVGTSIAVSPEKGDAVSINGKSYGLIEVKTDPAQAMWMCRAEPV